MREGCAGANALLRDDEENAQTLARECYNSFHWLGLEALLPTENDATGGIFSS